MTLSTSTWWTPGAANPALVFLHYWGGSARTWERVIRSLDTQFRCVAYDQRGWGLSDAPADGYKLQDLAQDAYMLIEALGLQRYVLVGHSMGGKVAQLMASQRPTGLEALILVAPASPAPQHIPEEARQAQLHAYDNRQTVLAAIDFLTVQRPDDAMLNNSLTTALQARRVQSAPGRPPQLTKTSPHRSRELRFLHWLSSEITTDRTLKTSSAAKFCP